jgi:hypothetical protein
VARAENKKGEERQLAELRRREGDRKSQAAEAKQDVKALYGNEAEALKKGEPEEIVFIAR